MRSYAGFALVAILTMAVIPLAGSSYAQNISIKTSADDHSGRFFGEGALRVVIEDEAADDSGSDEIDVDIDVEGTDRNFVVPDTSDGSQRFEFFLMHVDSFLNDSAGTYPDLDGIADEPTVITFGNGGDLDTGESLYSEARIEISYRDESITIDYEETFSALKLDRDSYGTTSFVYISVADQDANQNPTDRDEFTVDPDSPPNDDLFDLNGATFEDVITFKETGDNTGVFEGKYRLGESILVDNESLSLTLFDKANYGDDLDAPENDSNNSDEISFTVGNSDGTISVGGDQRIVTWDPVISADKESYSVGDTVHVTIADQDANVNSASKDSIQLIITSGQSEIKMSAIETSADTGIFEASFPLVEAGEGLVTSGSMAIIKYTDERPADYSDKVQAGQNPEKDFAFEINIKLPEKIGTEATDVTAPVPIDVAGGLGRIEIGDQVTLSTTVSNNNDKAQPYVAIIEIRDNSGVTVYLALRSGTLEPLESTDIGVSWQPDQAGAFEARTFVIMNLAGTPLSEIASSEITVT